MAARENSLNDFGLLIAYLIPGFTLLWGISPFFISLQPWLTPTSESTPTLGGFLYVTIAAIAAGMTISTLRWLTIDTLHHRTGITRPDWDFTSLGQNVQAFNVLIDIHYRHYLFHANALVSLLIVFVCRRLGTVEGLWWWRWTDGLLLLMMVVLYLGSRNTLANYYLRTGELLRAQTPPLSMERGQEVEVPKAKDQPKPQQSAGVGTDLPE